MRDKVILSEKCTKLANHVVDDPDGPAAADGGGGFSEALIQSPESSRNPVN